MEVKFDCVDIFAAVTGIVDAIAALPASTAADFSKVRRVNSLRLILNGFIVSTLP